MANEVSIANTASLMLGAGVITDFAEANDRSRLASNLWPLFRDWFLRSHYWNVAVKRLKLAPDVLTSAEQANFFDWSFRFTKPGDWLRTLQIGEKGAPLDYAAEGNYILADDNPLPFVYVYRLDVGSWDTAMQMAAALGMSALMAYGLTKSTSVAESQYAKFTVLLKSTRSIDGQDSPAETMGDFRLFASRFSGGFPGWNL